MFMTLVSLEIVIVDIYICTYAKCSLRQEMLIISVGRDTGGRNIENVNISS